MKPRQQGRTYSKQISQCELDLPRGPRGSNAAIGGTRHAFVGREPLGMIPRIEEIRPELQCVTLSNEAEREPLCRRDIPIIQAGLGNRSQSRISPDTECRVRKARGVEPLQLRMNAVTRIRIANAVRQHETR